MKLDIYAACNLEKYKRIRNNSQLFLGTFAHKMSYTYSSSLGCLVLYLPRGSGR